MTYKEIMLEIQRVQRALNTTKSQFTKRDYTKYLQKLKGKARAIERQVGVELTF